MKTLYCLFLSLYLSLYVITSVNAQPIIDSSYTEPQLTEQDPTNLNFPEPKHVLVVYRSSGDTVITPISTEVKNYYVQERGIPEENIVPLTLPEEVIYDTHVVQLVQNGEIIKDTTQAWADREPY
jgi:virulence-associated protein VagC